MKHSLASATEVGFGLHLTLDGYGCSRELLANMERVRASLDELPEVVGMTKISPPIVVRYDGGAKPEDWGYSGFTLIAESHITIHTFPSKRFVTVDIYTCKDFDPSPAIEYLKRTFAFDEFESETHRRGLRFART